MKAASRALKLSKHTDLALLAAYPYMNEKLIQKLQKFDEESNGQLNFLLDSGAFTAHNTGKIIKLDDYCKFIDSLRLRNFKYIVLDVIGDPERSQRNYETMLERGYNPIPVITPGDSVDAVHRYYETSEIICLGGVVGKGIGVEREIRIKEVMTAANGRKVHLLGYTRFEWLKHFRPYSCDSSTWAACGMYGSVHVYSGFGVVKKYNRQKFMQRCDDTLIKQITDLGFNMNEILQKDNWKGGSSILRKLGVVSWIKYQQDVLKNINTICYLAIASAHDCDLVTAGWHKIMAGKKL